VEGIFVRLSSSVHRAGEGVIRTGEEPEVRLDMDVKRKLCPVTVSEVHERIDPDLEDHCLRSKDLVEVHCFRLSGGRLSIDD
jgi:hypothetical protein